MLSYLETVEETVILNYYPIKIFVMIRISINLKIMQNIQNISFR